MLIFSMPATVTALASAAFRLALRTSESVEEVSIIASPTVSEFADEPSIVSLAEVPTTVFAPVVSV